jgi:hypothetical protein
MSAHRVPLAIAAAVAIVMAGVIVTLSQRAPRLTGSNAGVERSGVSLGIPGRGGMRCQDHQHVPGGTGRLRLFLGTSERSAGPLDVTIATGGRAGVAPQVVARGTVAGRFGPGTQFVALTPIFERPLHEARLCIVNRGPSAVTLSGDRTPVLGSGANSFGVRLEDDARIDYMYPRDRSWWGLSGTVAARFGLVKTSFFGRWTMWAMFGVVALLWGAVIVLLLRVMPRT